MVVYFDAAAVNTGSCREIMCHVRGKLRYTLLGDLLLNRPTRLPDSDGVGVGFWLDGHALVWHDRSVGQVVRFIEDRIPDCSVSAALPDPDAEDSVDCFVRLTLPHLSDARLVRLDLDMATPLCEDLHLLLHSPLPLLADVLCAETSCCHKPEVGAADSDHGHPHPAELGDHREAPGGTGRRLAEEGGAQRTTGGGVQGNEARVAARE